MKMLALEKIEDLDYYKDKYLGDGDISQLHISPGEYYLIIPRYEDMKVTPLPISMAVFGIIRNIAGAPPNHPVICSKLIPAATEATT